MIEYVTLINFESHERTKFCFDKGFNTIIGLSNSGKSSLVRALRYLAHGEWNAKNVRVGADFFHIVCKTDKGKIVAKKGKNIKEWKVLFNDGRKYSYTSFGRGVPPRISEALGFGKCELGGIEVGVNIGSQLERHFLLSEVEGEKVRASTASKIVDDLGGVKRVEELFDSLHDDRNKHRSLLRKSEVREEEEKEKRYDDATLSEFEEEVVQVEKVSAAVDGVSKRVDELELICGKLSRTNVRISELESKKNALSNLKLLSRVQVKCVGVCSVMDRMSRLSEQLRQNKAKRLGLVIPEEVEFDGVNEVLGKYKKLVSSLEKLESCSSEVGENRRKVGNKNERLGIIRKRMGREKGKFEKWLGEQDMCPLSNGEFFDDCKRRISK